jgi:peptide deformylase
MANQKNSSMANKTEILQRDNPILRQISLAVPIEEITTVRIQNLLSRMSELLSKEEDGVALAAPQIGEPLRIFIVSGKLLWFMEHPEEEPPKKFPKDLVFINPRILKLSKESKWIEEGCLSVRYLYGKMKRATKATISAYDENGKKFERGASGLMAQIFQHETDHLDGVLFIDKAKDIEDIPPEAVEKMNKKIN